MSLILNESIKEKLLQIQSSKYYAKGVMLNINIINNFDHLVVAANGSIVIVHEIKAFSVDINFVQSFFQSIEKVRQVYGSKCIVIVISAHDSNITEITKINNLDVTYSNIQIMQTQIKYSGTQHDDIVCEIHSLLHKHGYYLFDSDNDCMMAPSF
jgi:hypothetical protein